ncbi:four-carbon acid sugar kinase family protein [Arthrobacter sp. NPDC092385]|uniref:four-carbon acid sugar kinase family protein n=1 Tax=Arthrobacter sp. NPDC092385 TaxID=3363943 RepID=UPI00380DF864
MPTESSLLSGYPPEVSISAREVAAVVQSGRPARIFVVLDDDPTGTQSVADLPVLTRWDVEDFSWAFSQGKPAVYVLTNTRSLDAPEAKARNEEIVRNALTAAAAEPVAPPLGFVSRSDSTLRGHYPLEPDTIAATVLDATGEPTDGVVIVPAFPDAGRITIGGVHYVRAPELGEDQLVPVSDTEFARDATFGYRNASLARYVEEKTGGRVPADSVIVLDLGIIRAGSTGGGATASAHAIADALSDATEAAPIVADVVTENDLRALALGLEEAERRGKKLLYRVGPPFMRARIGQDIRAELTGAEAYAGHQPSAAGGLIVVGSHVGVTTRQLGVLTAQHHRAHTIEIDVEHLLDERSAHHLDEVVADVVAQLGQGDVILHTSRLLVRTSDAAASLGIARTVSAAVVAVVNRTLGLFPPRFVIAKGGITSSDVAAHGLQIRHAMVRGPMLPGIVSLWEPVDGPAQGIPFVVFAGNVGDDSSLAEVTRKLSSTF